MKDPKIQSETTKGAPERPERPDILPKRSTSKSNQRGQMTHQKIQSETTIAAPEGPEVLPKRRTSKSNQRAQMKHQKIQSETTKEAPERPEILSKRRTSKSNQRAQMKHQKVQSETTNRASDFHFFLVISIFFCKWPAHPASQGRRQHHINSVFGIRRGMMIQTLLLSLGTNKFENFTYQTASAVVFCCAANFSCNWQLLAKL